MDRSASNRSVAPDNSLLKIIKKPHPLCFLCPLWLIIFRKGFPPPKHLKGEHFLDIPVSVKTQSANVTCF